MQSPARSIAQTIIAAALSTTDAFFIFVFPSFIGKNKTAVIYLFCLYAVIITAVLSFVNKNYAIFNIFLLLINQL